VDLRGRAHGVGVSEKVLTVGVGAPIGGDFDPDLHVGLEVVP
jgi:hypothetical protein